jgi:DNA-binding NarL/FixJ family response regulator
MKKIHSNISPRAVKDRNRHREQIELLRNRLNLLEGKDRVLMTMYLENGNSIRQIARLLGVCESSIARRVCRLRKRLLDGEYIYCLRNRDKFTAEEMIIAKDYFLRGLSVRKIAIKRQLSNYSVRTSIKRIKRIIKIEILDGG